MMQEEKIIESQQTSYTSIIKKVCAGAWMILGVLYLFGAIVSTQYYKIGGFDAELGDFGKKREIKAQKLDNLRGSIEPYMWICLVVGVILLLWLIYSVKVKLIVTDKRIYGIACFGKRVDLPLDSISAVAQGWFKGIAVGTSSGKIMFVGISNRDEIYKSINNLLIDRQKNKKNNEQQINTSFGADELGKYKKLLDDGAITQEEYDAKKKQLLGL